MLTRFLRTQLYQSRVAGGRIPSVHASLHNYFNSERHLAGREAYKERRLTASTKW